MDTGGNFRPGRPQNPYFGYSTPARATDYPISVNTNIQGRAAWGRISFDVLKAIYDVYDVGRMCVNHKIDEIRSMEPMFLPADGVKDDVDDEIEAARLVLEYPDRELPYDSWVSKWLENALKYDSAPLYKRRDYNGDIIALEVVDGKTIFPYIDENGRRPRAEEGEPQPPAFAQIVKGMIGTWFTADDIIYVPFRPQEDSPYGMAPMESLLLTANTDLRFQWHFLQMFTDGSVPAGFMELPPDISRPEQVAEWQDFWDAMVLGDQAKLGQLIAVPNGSKFTATKPAAFDKTFPQYLMMRTCAGHGVAPQNVGLIEDVNRSTGDTQDEIDFRVHTRPWVRYVNGVLTRYLQRDIGLRVKVQLDTGREQEDRLAEAQAHQIYWSIGAESSDEIRSGTLGLPIDQKRPTPRTVLVERVGPIPLLSIEGIAGKTDSETYGPAADQPALDQPYVPPVGVIATPGTTDDKAALAAADQMQIAQRRQLEQEQGDTPARESREQKRARGAEAMRRQAEYEAQAEQEQHAVQPSAAASRPDEPQAAARDEKPVAKSLDGDEAGELLAFRTFVAGRVRKGEWRDFAFYTVAPHIAAELNRGGRAEVTAKLVAKAAANSGVPGLTKRSGMISLDLEPGTIPATPGGVTDHHITIVYLGPDVDDAAFDRACLRAQAAANAAGGPVDGSVGGLGSFPPSEASDGMIPAFAQVEVPAAHELYARLKDLSASGRRTYTPHVTLRYVPPGEQLPDPVPHTPVRFTHLSVHRGDQVRRYPLGGPAALAQADVVKARFDGPKAPAGQSADDWPGWRYDQEAAAYWAPRIAAALAGALDAQALVNAWLATRQHPQSGSESAQEREQQAVALAAIATAWLASRRAAIVRAMTPVLERLYTDGYVIGAACAQAYLAAQAAASVVEADLAHWTPGDTDAAQLLLGQWGDGSGLRSLLDGAGITITSIADVRLEELGKILGRGVADGLSPQQIADQIRGVLSNPSRALMIATTELSRAINAAAMGRWLRAGMLGKKWLTVRDAKVCPTCRLNQDKGVVPIDEPYPSGDMQPPDHPNDRCVSVGAFTEE